MDGLRKSLKGYFGRTIIASLLVRCLLLGFSVNALALEATDVIISSSAVPAPWGDHTIINTQHGAMIDWNNFNTNPAQNVTSNQSMSAVQSSTSGVLNRVSSGNVPTVFEGSLTVDGRIFVVNPTGIIFGAESTTIGHTGLLAATPSPFLLVGTENAQMEHQGYAGKSYHTMFAEAVINCKPASEPDHYLKNPDPKPTRNYEPDFSSTAAQGLNANSQEHKTVLVSDALTRIIGEINTPEEPNPAFVRTDLMKVIDDTHSNRGKSGIPKTVYEALKSQAGF